MGEELSSALIKVENIKNARLSIYDKIEIGDKNFWITSSELTALLNKKLEGQSFGLVPIRTRSKIANIIIASTLGYPVPNAFKKSKPRFPGQNFDKYVQKSNNLQIWNDELDPERRYVIIKIDNYENICKVRVITGAELAYFDTTGTLTQKYQAKIGLTTNLSIELISQQDTEVISSFISKRDILKELTIESPVDEPNFQTLIPIDKLFDKLKLLIGVSFNDIGHDQERNRGGELHKLVCKILGFGNFKDNGQFPDIKQQLIEIKLQTSSTIDLGLVSPDSESALDMEKINEENLRHCDIRYLVCFAENNSGIITIKNVILTTGKDFFKRFTKFGGKNLNKKLQIPLPNTFF